MLAMCKKVKKICFTGVKKLNENLKEKVFHKKTVAISIWIVLVLEN